MRTAAVMCVIVILTIGGMAFASYSAGETGTLTVNAPNSEDGSYVRMWGFYHTQSGAWKSATYGSGTVSNGTASITYTVPTDFGDSESAIFSWGVTARQSPGRMDSTSYYTNGADTNWGQFMQRDPDGMTLTIDTFRQDQTQITQTGASFRYSAQNETVFPNASWNWQAKAQRPWSGTLSDYISNNVYYDNGKTGLYPAYAADRGFTVTELETQNNWTKLLLSNDDGYSVELFGSKTLSSADASGYVYWTTLMADATLGSIVYDHTTGVATGTFDTPLASDIMYFIDAKGSAYVDGTDNDYQWLSGMGATDLLISGATIPEPATLALLGLGGLLLRKRK